jgi:hypothetical protein
MGYVVGLPNKKTFDFRSNRSYRKQWLVDYILNLHRDAKMKYNAESWRIYSRLFFVLSYYVSLRS